MTFQFNKISKTTVIGVLGFAIVELMTWQTLPAKASLTITVLALARAAMHFLQTDADLLQPQSPGNPTDEKKLAHPIADASAVDEVVK